MKRLRILVLLALATAPAARAQGPAAFQSPAYPTWGAMSGQIDRFSNEFNPAIGAVIDAIGDYASVDGAGEKDGFDLRLRLFELTVQANIDPFGWAYAVVAAEEDELAVEEAAAIYTGFDSNVTLKGGRFFVDFGKQMQTHVHDLRTPDRPLPLRTYLGDELGGDGLQFDNWFAAGESPIRYSLGVYASLAPEFEEDEDAALELVQPDRKQIDELSYSGRITGFTELGDSGTIQGGASARWIPEYALEADTDEVGDLDNAVWGLDLTYQRADDSGLERWLAGGELLFSEGDALVGTVDETSGLIDVADGSFTGWYVFGDYQWNRFNSAGVQISLAEIPVAGSPDDYEYEAYYTRLVSEFHRLRAFVAFADRESELGDEARIGIQYTLFLGPHAHGINW